MTTLVQSFISLLNLHKIGIKYGSLLYTQAPPYQDIRALDFTKTVRCVEFGSGDGSGEVFKQFTERYPNLKVVCLKSDFNLAALQTHL